MADDEKPEEASDETLAGASDEVADAAAEPAAPPEPEPDDTAGEAEDVGGDIPEETAAEEASNETPDSASDEVAEDQAEPAAPDASQPDDTGGEAEDVGGESAEDVGGDVPEAEGEASSEDSPKAKDAPPGAELDPIAIEPERELSAEERARAEAEAEERARLDAAATDDARADDEPVARAAVKLAADARIQATGKRKSSIARVIVQPGKGAFEINAHSLEEYFPRHQHQTMARQPLVTAGYEGAVDVRVRVRGGGIAGQAGAVRHGVARALTEIDPELRGELKRRGLLTRDARKKERRKAGLKKARKRPQFSKR
jgi:small subunit ribosomal protein S9